MTQSFNTLTEQIFSPLVSLSVIVPLLTLTTFVVIPLDQEHTPPDEVWGISTHGSDHVVECFGQEPGGQPL